MRIWLLTFGRLAYFREVDEVLRRAQLVAHRLNGLSARERTTSHVDSYLKLARLRARSRMRWVGLQVSVVVSVGGGSLMIDWNALNFRKSKLAPRRAIFMHHLFGELLCRKGCATRLASAVLSAVSASTVTFGRSE